MGMAFGLFTSVVGLKFTEIPKLVVHFLHTWKGLKFICFAGEVGYCSS